MEAKRKKTMLALRVTPEARAGLELLAVTYGQSMTGVLERLIREGVAALDPRLIPRR